MWLITRKGNIRKGKICKVEGVQDMGRGMRKGEGDGGVRGRGKKCKV